MRKVVLGCGSGRCGTYSLHHLLNIQKGANITHEKHPLPWDFDERKMMVSVTDILLKDESLVGDVGLYWVNYIPFLLSYVKDLRVICLQREKQATIDSFARRIKDKNLFTDIESEHFDYDPQNIPKEGNVFPKYDLPRDEATSVYWDEYYSIAGAWATNYSLYFQVFKVDELNSEEGQRKLLDFAGIKREDQVLDVGVKKNSNKELIFKIVELDLKCKKNLLYRCRICKEPATKHIMCNNYEMVMTTCDKHWENVVGGIKKRLGMEEHKIEHVKGGE